jgi:hypothetical protein
MTLNPKIDKVVISGRQPAILFRLTPVPVKLDLQPIENPSRRQSSGRGAQDFPASRSAATRMRR